MYFLISHQYIEATSKEKFTDMTRYKIISALALGVAVSLMLACGGGAANTAKTNAPANANANKPASTPTPASSPASNTSSEKTEKMGNKELDFTLVNKTGYPIKGVSIGPNGDADWLPEDEVLKGRTFADGASLEIKFNPKATATKWDLKIDWADGDPSVEWTNVDLTEVKKLTLKYDKASGSTSIE